MEDKVKIKPKKVLVEPKAKEAEWDAVLAYLEWWDKLDPALQKAATDYEYVRKVRRL